MGPLEKIIRGFLKEGLYFFSPSFKTLLESQAS